MLLTALAGQPMHNLLQCDDRAYDQNEQMLERLLAVDDVDAVHSNCAGLG